jgi:hypothetical protein
VSLQIGERRTEGDCIAVHVGKECDSHPGELTGTPYTSNSSASAASDTYNRAG